jgi:hypothetical protein
MTKASGQRVARRATKKKPPTAAGDETAAPGGNGKSVQAVQGGAAPQKQGKKVGTMKAADTKKLVAAENALLSKLAEVGDIAVQIEQARVAQNKVTVEVQRMRQDFQSLMRGVVISNGHDPDENKFYLDVSDGAIRQLN